MKKFIFLFVLFITAGWATKGQNVTFKASAPEAVVMGQNFRLTYTVNAEASDLRLQELSDFEVLMGPVSSRSHSTVITNGNAVSETTTTFTYTLLPKTEGTFNIPPATVKVKNSNYTSNGISVKVLPPDQAPAANQQNSSQGTMGLSNDDLFVRMVVSKNSVYEQESFLVTFKLYARTDVTFENVKLPEFEGFLVQEIELNNLQWVMENYNGNNYRTVTFKQYILFPQRSGKLTIGEGIYDMAVRVRTQQRVRSIFEDFFDTYQTVKKTLKSSPVTVDVKPLPSGKPANFSGAVGDFTMTADINTDRLKANEAVTINVKINGTGNVRLAKNPAVEFPNDFEIYDPKVETNIRTTSAGVSGSKNIEYMAIPRFGGEFEISPVEFSYFDLKTGTYKTLSSGPYKLFVERGEGGESSSVVSNFTNRENVRFLGQDIRFLKVKGFKFLSVQNIFFGSIAYILWYIIPALLFIIFFILYRKQIKENSNIALVRTKKANKMAVKRLKIAGKLLKDNKKEDFYEEILRALWGYLSDKLSIPQASLTKDNVESELVKYGVDESLINEFIDILNTCEFARYAPSQGSDAMDKLYQLTIDAIGKMESTIKKK